MATIESRIKVRVVRSLPRNLFADHMGIVEHDGAAVHETAPCETEEAARDLAGAWAEGYLDGLQSCAGTYSSEDKLWGERGKRVAYSRPGSAYAEGHAAARTAVLVDALQCLAADGVSYVEIDADGDVIGFGDGDGDGEYTVRVHDGSGSGDTRIRATSRADAVRVAQEIASEGWDATDSTWWVDVSVFDADGDLVDRVTVSTDPEPPPCEPGHRHAWCSPYAVVGGLRENPGVHGHGGGVIYTEACSHCGRYRVTDTWATRPDTGEQGLRAVAYREPDDASLAWVAENE